MTPYDVTSEKVALVDVTTVAFKEITHQKALGMTIKCCFPGSPVRPWLGKDLADIQMYGLLSN